MKEFVVYTALRIVLFLASFGIVIGLMALVLGGRYNLFWAVVLAFLVSGIASYFVLDRQREAFARRVEERPPARPPPSRSARPARTATTTRARAEPRAQKPVRLYAGSLRSAIAAKRRTESSEPVRRPARCSCRTGTAPR